MLTTPWVGNLTKWPSRLPSARFFRRGKRNNVKWLMSVESATHSMGGLTILYIQINRNRWCKLLSDKFKREIEMILLWDNQHAELVATGYNKCKKSTHIQNSMWKEHLWWMNGFLSTIRILCTILPSFSRLRLGLSLYLCVCVYCLKHIKKNK